MVTNGGHLEPFTCRHASYFLNDSPSQYSQSHLYYCSISTRGHSHYRTAGAHSNSECLFLFLISSSKQSGCDCILGLGGFSLNVDWLVIQHKGLLHTFFFATNKSILKMLFFLSWTLWLFLISSSSWCSIMPLLSACLHHVWASVKVTLYFCPMRNQGNIHLLMILRGPATYNYKVGGSLCSLFIFRRRPLWPKDLLLVKNFLFLTETVNNVNTLVTACRLYINSFSTVSFSGSWVIHLTYKLAKLFN